VVGVSDGDTITVLDPAKVQHKIRLSGIDAPGKGQAFGNSSKSLSKLVFDRQIEAQCHKKNRYGREVVQGHERRHRHEPRATARRDGMAVSGIREGAERGGASGVRARGRNRQSVARQVMEGRQVGAALGVAAR
jgi:hypothetical protein